MAGIALHPCCIRFESPRLRATAYSINVLEEKNPWILHSTDLGWIYGFTGGHSVQLTALFLANSIFFLSPFLKMSRFGWIGRLVLRELACPSQRDRTDGEWVGRGKSDVRCKQRWRRAQLYGKGGGGGECETRRVTSAPCYLVILDQESHAFGLNTRVSFLGCCSVIGKEM